MEENEEKQEKQSFEEKRSDDRSPINSGSLTETNEEHIWLAGQVAKARSSIKSFIVGQEELVDLLIAALFSQGHVLLEGVPGVAKTLSSKVLAKTLDIDFSRIQFTPDLMPSDVIGTSIFDMKESKFEFKKGPVFSNMVLIDEINRAPAKTQAALFEVMEERQITYDGKRYTLEKPFMVVATQNPIEQEGTYNLPEAQLDRFLFKITIQHPTLEDEIKILERYQSNEKMASLEKINPILKPSDINRIQKIVDEVKISPDLGGYIAKLVDKTRAHAQIYLGASPRGSLSILKSAKAVAAIAGRDFVTPDDIQLVAPYVLNHRIILTAEAEMEGVDILELIKELTKEVEVPR